MGFLKFIGKILERALSSILVVVVTIGLVILGIRLVFGVNLLSLFF